MKSKTKISKQVDRKTNKELVETILAAKKSKPWLGVAGKLSSPRRKFSSANLSEINEKVGDNKKILIVGKVLSQGDISKKVKIVALNFSEKAKEKLLKGKVNFSTIAEEIKSNPEMKDLKILEK